MELVCTLEAGALGPGVEMDAALQVSQNCLLVVDRFHWKGTARYYYVHDYFGG